MSSGKGKALTKISPPPTISGALNETCSLLAYIDYVLFYSNTYWGLYRFIQLHLKLVFFVYKAGTAGCWMMALTGLLLLELGLYASCFVCGIVTAASLTIVQGNFGGLCMLYGHVSYNATANAIGVQSSSSSSLCYFVSAISVMVAVVCFSLSLYWMYTFCIDGDIRRERMWMNLIVAVCGVFLFFLLITGCMLKIGRDSLCTSVTQTVPNITRCEDAQARKWVSPLKGGRFYNSLHKAETAVWVNFFFWLIIGVLVVIQRRQSSGSKMIGGHGDYGGPAGGLFGDPGVTAAETEPFFNRPPRPQ